MSAVHMASSGNLVLGSFFKRHKGTLAAGFFWEINDCRSVTMRREESHGSHDSQMEWP